MRAYRLPVVVPEDRRVTIEFPAEIPAGPVEVIVLVPPQEEPNEAAEARVARLKREEVELEEAKLARLRQG